MNNGIPKPKNSSWTDDQWRAITTSGNNILVAAAAGSGKTAVLVERIIKKITDTKNPVDVDRLLVVTFTNAAAQEMKKRVGEALEKEISKHPSSIHLRKQLTLLNRASISTLHSFCLNVLRKYYYHIDLDPSFRIADETEAELLMEEVMEELFEEQYSLQNNERFYDVVDRYSDDRSDLELQVLIRKLYDFSRSHPWPDEWLQQMIQSYDIGKYETIDDISWIKDLREDIDIQLKGCKELLARAMSLTKQPGGPLPYADTIVIDQQLIEDLLLANTQSWQEIHNKMESLTFPKLKSCRGKEYSKTLQDQAKNIRDQVKKRIKKLQEELFSRKPEHYLKDIQEMKPIVETLVTLVQDFARRYDLVKKEKGIVDFADLEHYCLQILLDGKTPDGKWMPSSIARDYQMLFQEVLVDEYQDTNLVQEAILQLVSNAQNLFMVGDVKQSIYRFRLAEPHLFLTKYKQFHKENSGDCLGYRIDLSKNFRSRKEILEGTNFIFKQIMNQTVGEMEYDDDAELKHGNKNYPASTETKTELLLIDKKDPIQEKYATMEQGKEETENTDLIELETVQLEARVIGLKIKELIEKPFKVTDKQGNQRNVTYRDIVLLLRSMPWAEAVMEEFKELGIPVYAELSTGYFEATEVTVMLSLLKIIDNPYQDIPLAAVLRSPIVGVNEEQLAMIRLHDKKNHYFDLVKSYANTGSNVELKTLLKEFCTRLTDWRTKARQGALSELIWQLYRDTGYYDYVGGLVAGKQRQANLRALYDRAKQYEETSFRGLFRFLRFIERLQDRGEDLGTARALGEQEDVVRMMTIHKSKGLEFPIVFVAGLNRQFNLQDLRRKVLLHKELGFGSKFVDPKLRIIYPTLPFLAMKRRLKMELLAEEMRVLYVAFTRAKEKLYMVGTVNDAEKAIEKWNEEQNGEQWILSDFIRANAKSYLDWIGPALIRHRDCTILSKSDFQHSEMYTHPSKWNINILNADNFPKKQNETVKQNIKLLDEIKAWHPIPMESPYKQKVDEQLSWQYPYLQAQIKRSKQSVSEIKSRKQVADAFSDTRFVNRFTKGVTERPRFLQEKGLTAVERGTAMHMVMQHIDLSSSVTKEDITNLLDTMVRKELLTDEQKNVIDVDSITHFFQTPLGKRLRNAKKVKRELPFSLALPAKEVYPDWQEEDDANILVQGIMDCVFEDEQGLVLLDYKTDAVSGRFQDEETARKILEDRYRIQINIYARAIQDIWKYPHVEKYLFFFDSNLCIQM